MLHPKNIMAGLSLTIFSLALLFVASGGLTFGNGADTGKTTLRPVTQPSGTIRPVCAPLFVIPEGMSFPNSEGGACEATPAASPAPDLMAKPQRPRTCRCSCGYPCQTSADCGGGSCDPFITCC